MVITFYTGNGCSLHPDCFTCPFPDCTTSKPLVGGEKRAVRLRLTEEQREGIKSLASQGHSRVQIAGQLGVSRRSVGRNLKD